MEQAEVLIMNILRWMDLDELMEEDLYDAIDHGELVGRLANMMCLQLGCPIEFQRIIVQAAYLHDIGKLKNRFKIRCIKNGNVTVVTPINIIVFNFIPCSMSGDDSVPAMIVLIE